MKLIRDLAPFLLQLLLLAELLVRSSSRPTADLSLCGMLGSMIHQVESLIHLSKKLHGLTGDELTNFAGVENRLHDLPHIPHNTAYFNQVKVNESLSQLFVDFQSFKLHIDWLKTVKENVNFPSQSAEHMGTHLLLLSSLLNASLHQVGADVPQPPSASLPVASTAFDVLHVSVEISEHLQVFCKWSKRVLVHLKKKSRCPKL